MIEKKSLQLGFNINFVINEIKEFISINKNHVIIITGPTSSGKTALSHLIYNHINSRLISVDSRQIYKETSIGSSKPNVIDHMMFDGNLTSVVSDNNFKYLYWQLDRFNLLKDYSAQNFREDTRSMIDNLHKKTILPIIVGGSIHWIRSLISETISPFYISDEKMYLELCNLSIEELQKIYIQEYSKENVNESDWNNSRRLSRAIEYKRITGKSLYDSTIKINDKNNYLIFEIEIDRKEHKEKIRKNITDRIERGWIDEVENILKKYSEDILDKLGQGYRIIGNYILDGKKLTYEELIEKITIAEMRYAKKQRI